MFEYDVYSNYIFVGAYISVPIGIRSSHVMSTRREQDTKRQVGQRALQGPNKQTNKQTNKQKTSLTLFNYSSKSSVDIAFQPICKFLFGVALATTNMFAHVTIVCIHTHTHAAKLVHSDCLCQNYILLDKLTGANAIYRTSISLSVFSRRAISNTTPKAKCENIALQLAQFICI